MLYCLYLIYVGTSTDVSRYSGQYEHVFETTTAGVTIQAPQVSALFILATAKVSYYYRLKVQYPSVVHFHQSPPVKALGQI